MYFGIIMTSTHRLTINNKHMVFAVSFIFWFCLVFVVMYDTISGMCIVTATLQDAPNFFVVHGNLQIKRSNPMVFFYVQTFVHIMLMFIDC